MSFVIFQKKKTLFNAIKRRSSKSRKNDILPKGLTHCFSPEMAIFRIFFYAIQARKMPFMIFWNEKTPFQVIKTRSLNSRKFDIFPKGLTHGFRRKMAIFFNYFLLGNEGQENLFYGILERKNVFLGYKNNKFKKSKNCHFSKGVNPWFWLKNGHFFNFFFWSTQARKMSFLILQHEKRPFQSIKTRSSNIRKFDIFPNGLTHGFGPKMAIFPTFFFRQYSIGKCLL